MMNLKSLEKKLYFKVLLHLGVLLLIGFTFVIIFNVMDTRTNEYNTQRTNIIKTYDVKIKNLDSINGSLKSKQSFLENKIDSLQTEKNKIRDGYDKKIKNIYDASAIDHAVWMDSVLKKLDNIKKQ